MVVDCGVYIRKTMMVKDENVNRINEQCEMNVIHINEWI